MLTPDQELRAPRQKDLNRALRRRNHRVRCAGVGRSVFGVNNYAADSSPLAPNDITSATLRFWYDQTSYNIGTTMLHTAGTGPAVTLTGTLQQPLEIKVRGTSNGARGTATYAVDLNGTLNFQTGTTSAVPIAIGATGISINFGTGSNYSTTDVYKAVDNILVDRIVPTTNDLSNGTSGQRPLIIYAGPGGLQTNRYNGSSDRLINTTSSVWNTVFGGTNSPFTVVWVGGIITDQFGVTAFWSSGHTTDVNIPNVSLKKNGVNNYQITRRATVSDVVTINSLAYPISGNDVIIWRFDGLESRLRVRGIDIIGGESMVDGTQTTSGSITVNQMCLSALKTTSTGNFANNDVSELVGFQGAVSDNELFRLENYFLN